MARTNYKDVFKKILVDFIGDEVLKCQYVIVLQKAYLF